SLMTRGEESGCIELSEVNEFVDAFDLDEADLQRLFDEIERRGYELTDDCGRDVPEQVAYANDDLAVVTTDALQLFLTDLRRYPLLTAAQAVERGIANGSRLIRLPVYIVERERRIVRAERALAVKLGRQPTDAEVARMARLPVKQVQDVRSAARTVASLDKPVGEEQDTALGDLLVSDESGPAEQVELNLREEALRQALAQLPDQQREVLELRFGMTAELSPKTLDEVVHRLGISRNRVRKLEADGLSRLAQRREIAALGEAL